MRRHLRGRVEFIWGLFDLVPVMVAAVWGGRRCLRGVWWGGGHGSSPSDQASTIAIKSLVYRFGPMIGAIGSNKGGGDQFEERFDSMVLWPLD